MWRKENVASFVSLLLALSICSRELCRAPTSVRTWGMHAYALMHGNIDRISFTPDFALCMVSSEGLFRGFVPWFFHLLQIRASQEISAVRRRSFTSITRYEAGESLGEMSPTQNLHYHRGIPHYNQV